MTAFHRRVANVDAVRLPAEGEDVPPAFHEFMDRHGDADSFESSYDESLIVHGRDQCDTARPGDWLVSIAGDAIKVRVFPDALFSLLFRETTEANFAEAIGPEFRDALMICLIKRLGAMVVLPVAEVDAVGGDLVTLESDAVKKRFTLHVRPRS